MTDHIELAVVGAGPAGLAAAAQAVDLGLPVTLVDVFDLPGGQYYKQTPPALGKTKAPDKYSARILAAAEDDAVRLLAGASVWGFFPEDDGYLLCLYGPPGTPRRLKAKAVILAPGAHDRPVPFPGWTLPDRDKIKFALRLGKVKFEPERHDGGAKEILGQKIPAGMGEKEIERVLEIVSTHPSTYTRSAAPYRPLRWSATLTMISVRSE